MLKIKQRSVKSFERRCRTLGRLLCFEELGRRLLMAGDAGLGPNETSGNSAISASGRYVAFDSQATNLVHKDTNGIADVFVFDRMTGRTIRVSVGESGAEANGTGSANPALSEDGGQVAFASDADNLIASDLNGETDIYLHDLMLGTTERISIGAGGTEPNGASFRPTVSADGRYVAFESDASNLVADDTNGRTDVFVYDRQSVLMQRVSVGDSGIQANGDSFAPSLSADGRVVAFESDATNLVGDDVNLVRDIFVHELDSGSTERVSLSSAGVEANDVSLFAILSGDGSAVAFESDASNLVPDDTNAAADIFFVDRDTGITERVSVDGSGLEANDDSFFPTLDFAGEVIVFSSLANNLIAGDLNGVADIFVHDRAADTIERISGAANAGGGDSPAFQSAISSDGGVIAFETSAQNLGPADSNCVDDIFVWQLGGATIEAVTLATAVLEGAGELVDLAMLTDASHSTLRTIDIRGTGDNQIIIDAGRIAALTPEQSLLVISDQDDSLEFDDVWALTGTAVVANQFERAFSSGAARLRIVGPFDWTNPIDVHDIDGNGRRTASDALNLINALLRVSVLGDGLLVDDQFRLVDARGFDPGRFRFYDPSGDGRLTAVDAISTINRLFRDRLGAAPSGVAAAQSSFTWLADKDAAEAELEVAAAIGLAAPTKLIAGNAEANELEQRANAATQADSGTSRVDDRGGLAGWDQTLADTFSWL